VNQGSAVRKSRAWSSACMQHPPEAPLATCSGRLARRGRGAGLAVRAARAKPGVETAAPAGVRYRQGCYLPFRENWCTSQGKIIRTPKRATSSSPSPSVRQGWGAGTATHDAGGLPHPCTGVPTFSGSRGLGRGIRKRHKAVIRNSTKRQNRSKSGHDGTGALPPARK
jgi:hypothetical protein